VRLPRGETHHLRPEAGEIVVGGDDRHELDAAAGRGEGKGPEGVRAGPRDHLVEAGRQEVRGPAGARLRVISGKRLAPTEHFAILTTGAEDVKLFTSVSVEPLRAARRQARLPRRHAP